MIVTRRLDPARLARYLGPPLVVLLAYDFVITSAYVFRGWRVFDYELPLPLLGSAIALIVTFRNNASYERWWEARALWGQMVNNSRSFARGVLTLVADAGTQASLVRLQVAYVLAVRCLLRREPPWDAIAPHVPAPVLAGLRDRANVPAAIQGAIAAALAEARASGRIDPTGLVALDRTLTELSNAQGGLERIKNTPLPRQYSQFPQVFVAVYCMLLPIGLVHDLRWFTPLASTVVGFMFLSLDRIGRDLEDPFEGTMHDVPLHAVARTIEIDLLQAIGAADVPEPLREVDGILR